MSKSTEVKSTAVRPLHIIADDIRRNWKNVNFAAVPYLNAMRYLDTIDGDYGYDSARSIVLYFRSNSASWRGEDAKRIKKELDAMLKASR